MPGPWEDYQSNTQNLPTAIETPPWQDFAQTPPYTGPERRSQPRPATGLLEDIQAGWEGSATGLLMRGRLPDVVLDPSHAKWYDKLVAGGTQMVSEFPEMALGAFIGSSAGPFGTAAGTFAIPTLIRESLMQAYDARDVQSSGEFLARTGIVLKKTARDAAIGALTYGAGSLAGKALEPFASPLIQGIGTTAAEIGSLAVSPSLLDGKLPEPEDFLNAAIMVLGMRGARALIQGAKTTSESLNTLSDVQKYYSTPQIQTIAGTMREIYAKTGLEPLQVVSEASKDPELRDQIIRWEGEGGRIPDKFQPLAFQQSAIDAIKPDAKDTEMVASPFAIPPQPTGTPKLKLNVNYDYIKVPEDIPAVIARAVELNKDEILRQTRGQVSWSQTETETAKRLADLSGASDYKMLLPREPGTAGGTVDLLVREKLMTGAAEKLKSLWDNYDPQTATPQQKVEMLQAAATTRMLAANFIGESSEAGRMLQILQKSQQTRQYAGALKEMLDKYGASPDEIAAMGKQIKTPEGTARFAKGLVEASTWDKVVEAWKAGLISGPLTDMANIVGNTTFQWLRVPVDSIASVIGKLRGNYNYGQIDPGTKVELMEPVARVAGILQGTMDGLKIAKATFDANEMSGKAEQFKTAIPGKVGATIRKYTFGRLSAEDAFSRTTAERGEAYTLATREAMKSGLNPLSHEFREEVVRLANNPTPEMADQIKTAGTRLTFNTPLGTAGQSIQNMVRKNHLEAFMPFIRTPGNIAKELVRMTPFAPFVEQWRADIKAGGAAADKAVAEVMLGSAVSATVIGLARSGMISGAGDPDPGKRRVALSAGWQPYSVKIGDIWYNYARIQPFGTLVGLAADIAETWDHFDAGESDKVPKMISVAFANAITNQTFLQGIAGLSNAVSDPTRYGAQMIDQLAGSVVPGIVSQPARMFDPLAREIDSSLDAIKSRIPGLRQTLYPKIDVYGEPIKNRERLGEVLPITTQEASKDPVRTEAERLQVSVGKTPSAEQLPAGGDKKLGQVKLTQEQQDIFARESGKLAYEILTPIVNGSNWSSLPDMVQREIYQRVFEQTRKLGAVKALSTDQRMQEINRIQTELRKRLMPKEAP